MTRTLACGERVLVLDRTLIMGVVNVTPDSFSESGRALPPSQAASRARALVAEGADLIDLGGESTRPGAEPVPARAELDRVLPVIEALTDLPVPISIDTTKPEVAAAACAAGATMINDVSGAQPAMLAVARECRVPIVAVHMQGTPRTMQQQPVYRDVVGEVESFLGERLAEAKEQGVVMVLDPGIGFGKTREHNLALLRALPRLCRLGAPLLVGASRKSFLGSLTGRLVHERVHGSVGAHVAAALRGADMVRVHDVAAHRDALRVAQAIAGPPRRMAVLARGVPCAARIGVGAAERASAQLLVVDLEARLDGDGGDDRLEGTVDYERLAGLIHEVAGERERQLVETLAEDIAARALADLRLLSVRVCVTKPAAGARYSAELGAELERTR